MDIALSVYLLVGGHFSCFLFLAIVNNSVVNINMQVFVCIPVLNSFVYIPRNGIAGWSANFQALYL